MVPTPPLIRLRTVRLALIMAVAVMTTCACDPGSSLGIINDSDDPVHVLLLTHDPDAGDLRRVWKVDPHSTAALLSRNIGPLSSEIHLLDSACEERGTWQSPHGGLIRVGADGCAEFIPDEGPGPGAGTLQPVLACGATPLSGSARPR